MIPWKADLITLHPEAFPGALGVGVLGRALKRNVWQLQLHDLRTFGVGPHRNVDDTPAGGGAGMVMRADVALAALDTIAPAGRMTVYPSPRGRLFDAQEAARWASLPGVIVLCGRFEGVDERIFARRAVHEVSLGNFILCGGEAAAAAMIEASVRLLPAVTGNPDSIVHESFTDDGLPEHAQYTRPQVVEGLPIPAALTGGNHAAVSALRSGSSRKAARRFAEK